MEIDRSDLDNLVPKIRQALDRSVQLNAQDLWGNLMENSPVRTGNLAGSWSYRNTGFMRAKVGTNVAYALIQNDGVDPFAIFPRTAEALYWPGADHPVQSVLHPGFAGTQYIEGSIAQTEGRNQDFVEIALNEVDLN